MDEDKPIGPIQAYLTSLYKSGFQGKLSDQEIQKIPLELIEASLSQHERIHKKIVYPTEAMKEEIDRKFDRLRAELERRQQDELDRRG